MPGTILVVEDHDALRMLYAQEFSGDGYVVEEAADARSALESAARARPDIVVLDARVAGRQGVEALARTFKQRGCRVVVNTGSLAVLADDRVARVADALVLKSADLGLLKEAVRTLLAEAAPASPARAEGRGGRSAVGATPVLSAS